ncbi:MAG: DEAD/DEAH box helicase family protein, partial [Candidatus Geothermincolia bacterium]
LDLSFEPFSLIRQVVDEAMAYPADEKALMRLMEAAPRNLFTGEADTFENLRKHFYDLRRVTNRTIKELGEDKPVAQISDLPDKADVVDQLEALREEKAELLKLQTEYVTTASQRSELQEKIESLTLRLEDAGDPDAAAKKADEVQGRMHVLSSQSDGKRMQASTYTETADRLESAGKACPLGPEGLVECSMGKPKREKLVGELRARAKAVTEEADKIDLEIKPLGERMSELKELKGKTSRTGIQFQIDAAQAELEKLPASDVDPDQVTADMATLNERVRNGEDLLARVNREEGAAAEREKVQAKRAELEQTAGTLNALVEVLSSAGLPGKILSETIEPIETRANERLQRLTGGRYNLRLVTDPDFAIIVDHDGVSSPLKLLSSSEQQRVGIILQDAIVHLSGLRFLIIDEADKLDPDNRALLLEFLLDVAEDYDQIIVLSTIGPDGVNAPETPIDELALFLLEDGQLREVG